MNTEFNKQILFDNINYLVKQKNIKIGELESEAGVSVGYLSRASKDGGSNPGIEFIVKVASIFNISIDTLVSVNLSSITPTEEYLIDFLTKLNNDTIENNLDWCRESKEELNSLRNDIYDNSRHPLFEVKTFFEQTESEYPSETTEKVFVSNSYDVHTSIVGDCFSLKMKDRTTLYIMNIAKTVRRSNDSSAYAKEIWISRFDDQQFLCSNHNDSTLGSFVDQLYTNIQEYIKHPRINPDVKDVLDAYLNDGLLASDEDNLPF